MVTNVSLYMIIGMYCLFVYGTELEGKPLITMNLPDGIVVYILKVAFSLSVMTSISLCSFPANTIVERYLYKDMPASTTKTWIINFQRATIIGLAITCCILLGSSLNKFNSLIGTIAAAPVAFMIPCIMHYKLCSPTKFEKFVDIVIIIFSVIILIFCSGFTIWTWNE